MPRWAAIMSGISAIIASHKRMGALKTHQFSKVAIKHVTPATKRG